MAAVAKKCYYSNISKIILFDFYSRATHCLIEELTLRSEREKSQPALSGQPLMSPFSNNAFHNTRLDVFINNIEIQLNKDVYLKVGESKINVIVTGCLFEDGDTTELLLKPATSSVVRFRPLEGKSINK